MHVYAAVHAPPHLGPNPLTTIVSPMPMSEAEQIDLVYKRLPIQILRINTHRLEYPPVSSEPSLAIEEVKQRYADCARCHLCESRNRIAWLKGNPYAAVMALGEGPGITEDIHGIPFCGRSGRLQDQMFVESNIDPLGEIAWGNVTGCRPCDTRSDGDRPPTIVEAVACSERLVMTLRAIRPRIVLCMGAVASSVFFDEEPPPNTWHSFGTPPDTVYVGVVRHPAYLVRVIASPHSYHEYYAAKLFYRSLRGMINPDLKKVSAWPFGPRFLHKVTGPMTGGRP